MGETDSKVGQIEALALWAAAHVLVPLALVGMLGGVVHYLLDVRSVLLGYGTFFLKWVATLFVVAAVLIGRYGRVHRDKGRKGLYSLALGAAMFLVLSMFGLREGVLWAYVFHLAVVSLLFWLASTLTALLDLEDHPEDGGGDLFAMAAAMSYQAGVLVPDRFTEEVVEEHWWTKLRERDALNSPARAVGLISLAVLAMFAAGGPLLLRGEAGIARTALGAVVVYLLSAGVLLAAGVATSSVREVRRRGGQASVRVLGLRLALALALLGPALVVGLGAPGLDWVGSGEVVAAGEGAGTAKGGSQDKGSDSKPSVELAPSAPSGWLAALVKAAAVMFKVVAILAAVWLAWQVVRRLPKRVRKQEERVEPPKEWPDPFAGLSAVRAMAPREGVVATWERYEALCGRSGHERPARSTASEFVRGLPRELRSSELAEIYALAAWSDAETPGSARDRALDVLLSLRRSAP